MPIVTVTFHWDDRHGHCYDCGNPAAFVAPDLFWNRERFPAGRPASSLSSNNLLCAVCAAQAACDGERIFRLFVDDIDPPVSDEHVAILAELGIVAAEGDRPDPSEPGVPGNDDDRYSEIE